MTFKPGDLVCILPNPGPLEAGAIVTRCFDDGYVAIGYWDVLGPMLLDEEKAKPEDLILADPAIEIIGGVTGAFMREELILCGYFKQDETGGLVLVRLDGRILPEERLMYIHDPIPPCPPKKSAKK